MESWSDRAAVWEAGPAFKQTASQWQSLGYVTRSRRVNATQVGGAVDQVRYLVVRLLKAASVEWTWAHLNEGKPSRPMSNPLTPPGLSRNVRSRKHPPDHVERVWDPRHDPLPWPTVRNQVGWIRTETGVRQLTLAELGKSMGGRRSDYDGVDDRALWHLLERTTSRFHWEFITQCLRRGPSTLVAGSLEDPALDPDIVLERLTGSERMNPATQGGPCLWVPPDLTPGRTWHWARVNSLSLAARTHGAEWFPLFNQGLDSLRIHSGNYSNQGAAPTQLQVLWWEFPAEH